MIPDSYSDTLLVEETSQSRALHLPTRHKCIISR